MRIIARVVIARPADALFWLSQDYERRLEWDSYLSEAYLIGSSRLATVGAESFCRSRGGSVMVSRYISFEPPSHAAVEMIRGPWVLSKFGGTWRFRPQQNGSTEVRFIYNFTVRPAALQWMLEPLVGVLFRRDMRHRLEAFRRWAENGAEPTIEQLPP
jgi:ribosome-associated toxin RatA of RatAB toxin-antitoxin module